MDAIERVEVAVRTALVMDLAMASGPFAHVDASNFPDADPKKHATFLEELRNDAWKSKESFVEHFKVNYDEHPDLPIWAAAETMTLGSLLTLFRMCPRKIQGSVAKRYGLPGQVLQSWLQTLLYARNICAHHARLWNRELAIKPTTHRSDPKWDGVATNRTFVLLTLLNQMLLQVAPQSRWRPRLFELLDTYKDVPVGMMGMPPNWREHPLWQTH